MTRAELAELEAIVRRCSFCGRDVSDVRWLVAGPDDKAFICDVCILLAVHALADRLAGRR